MPDETRYGFGKNWQKFLAQVNDERKRTARHSIIDFTGLADLRGKTFLDIGCGSGLFSLAAHDLGAEKSSASITTRSASVAASTCTPRPRARHTGAYFRDRSSTKR